MPRRRRADGPRPRRWPFILLFALGTLAGVALWAYAPDLPREVLIQRYANEHSKFIEVAGAQAHVRDEGKADAMPLLLIHGSLGSLQMWDRRVGAELRWRIGRARQRVVGDIGIYSKPERLVRRSLLEVYADPAMVTPGRVKQFGELQRFPGNRQATLIRARTQEPLDPSPLKRLDVPTLIIWGAKDRWVPVADGFRFQNDIKGSKLAIFENLGHDPMEENPKAPAEAAAAVLPAEPPPTLAPPPQPPDPPTPPPLVAAAELPAEHY